MGNWTLGRVGLDVVANSEDAPSTFTVSGDEVEFSGVLRASSLADAKFLRLQLNGLVDNVDEPVVPFYWSEDASGWDGYYRVVDVSVGMVPMSLNASWFPFTVKMVRVADGWQAPLVESRLLGALRANAHSVVVGSTQPWWAVPVAFKSHDLLGTSPTTATRTSSDGALTVYYTTNGTLLYDQVPTFQAPATDWYDGSARIELSGDGGTTYRAVTGRQIINLPTAWRLSNGLVRVTPLTEVIISMSVFDGSQWDAALTFGLYTGTVTAITVLRNSPEICVIRLWIGSAVSGFSATVDLGLRRGSRYVDGFLSSRTSAAYGLSFGASPVASTAITGGIHATADDAGNNRRVIATPKAKTNDLTNGNIVLSSPSTTFPFMIGSEVGGSGAAVPDRAADLVAQYLAATNEVQRIVQR